VVFFQISGDQFLVLAPGFLLGGRGVGEKCFSGKPHQRGRKILSGGVVVGPLPGFSLKKKKKPVSRAPSPPHQTPPFFPPIWFYFVFFCPGGLFILENPIFFSLTPADFWVGSQEGGLGLLQ